MKRNWQDDLVFLGFMIALVLAGAECKDNVVQHDFEASKIVSNGWETGRQADTGTLLFQIHRLPATVGAGRNPTVFPRLRQEIPPASNLSSRLQLSKVADSFENLMRERGFSFEPALICILATAYHESRFQVNAESKERDGSISRGLIQMNSRGMGRGFDRSTLLSIEGQVDIMSNHKGFLRWYKEVKTQKLPIAKAMQKLTDNVIRCAKRYRAERIKTVTKWWEKVNK